MSKICLLQVPQLQDKKKWNSLTLQENLTRCYEKNLYVDAVVKVQDKIFRVHRSILCFHSPVLKNAFYSKEVPATTCTIKEIKPEGFEILLRYLYTSEISDEVQTDGLVEACYAAQILQMVEIGEKLIHHILYSRRYDKSFTVKSIAEGQFWQLLEKCRLLRSSGDLQKKLVEFAESNFTPICDGEGFVKADIKTLKLVFDRQFYSVPQKYVLESIARWVEANDHLVYLDKYIRELLNCVDFEMLSPKEFYAVASRYDRLLLKKDSLDILMHLIDPTVCSLPEYCKVYYNGWRNIPAIRERLGKKNKFKSVAPPCGKTLQETFYQMLSECLFTDVILIAKDNIKIPAHGLILALGSEFFADIFYHAAPTSKILHMEETAEEVKDMLRYFYGCESGNVFDSTLVCILRKTDIALKYQCYPLMQDCNNALLRTTLNPVNFWTLTAWVDRLASSKVDRGSLCKPDQSQSAQAQVCVLSDNLMRYAATSTKHIFEHYSFLKASKGSLVRVLKSDYLNMAEVDILEYVARWMEENANQVPSDRSKRRLLRNIRFESLVAGQFFAFLQNHKGVLPSQDSFLVLQFLFRRSEENRLPQWCYRGPLRSLFYDPSTKIGTSVPVPWSDSPEKGKKFFFSSYMVSIRNKEPRSEIQFLELSLNFNAPVIGQCSPDCSCSISIKTADNCFLKTFQNLNMSHQQRYLLPVCFNLDASYNRSFKLIITVDAKHSHKFYSVSKQALEFDNVAFLPTSGEINCLCDAIVDGFTSENVLVPPHLLSENRNKVVTTDKCFKIM